MTYRVGLTGGIGVGKSSVSRLFLALGIPVIDADVVARKVVEPGTVGLQRLEEHFGSNILDEGRLDRRRLREIIFSNQQARKWVETLLHPLIQHEMLRMADEHSAPYVILEIPLLFEARWRAMVDRVLVVDAAPALQVQRIKDRDRVSDEAAEAVINAQMGARERCALADDVIDNSGDLDVLEERVRDLHALYLEKAGTQA
jgi:dephospho-CoA kinase